MSCCQDMRSVWCSAAGSGAGGGGGGGGGSGVGGGVDTGSFLTNIISAAGAISQLRLQAIFDNVKPPLQQALGSRHSGPIIVGGLATGVLIYCGHRWLNSTAGGAKQKEPNGWKLEPAGTGDADTEDVHLGLEASHFGGEQQPSIKESVAVNPEQPLGLLEFEEIE